MHRAPDTERNYQSFEYFAQVVCNVVLLYVSHRLLDWRINFLTNDLDQVLGRFSIAFIVAIIANIAFLCRPPLWFVPLGKAAASSIMLWAIIGLYRVFPFAFTDAKYNTLTHAILALAIIGTGIAIVVETVKLIVATSKRVC